MNPIFNSYSQQGYSSYGAGGMYNSSMYGAGGYHANPFNSTGGYGLGNSNTFLRSAEESSRGAFQSIESVVHAFSAVSAMFESTYYAVYNS
jgi:peroxin-13